VSTTDDIWILRRGLPGYPSSLISSPDPPGELFGIGDPSLLTKTALAIVGSRKSTPYGRACAEQFARWAAERDIVVVSGGAAGCDVAAHKAALKVGKRTTIAVLGSGVDIDYPASSSSVLDTIRHVGAVVSEIPPKTHPRPWMFVRRNRIIAALSSAVLIVEAALPSGTFSTADHALAAGRDVLAVPGSIFATNSAGTNRLIAQGATPITSVEALAEALDVLELTPGPTRSTQDPSNPNEVLFQALASTPQTADSLARSLTRDLVSVLCDLSRLELEGRATRHIDGTWHPTGVFSS